jgi:hypothetical protein
MKRCRFIVAWLCVWGLATTALADVYSSALQKAHDVANQNNIRQNNISRGLTPPPGPPPPQPNPVLEATLQNITNLEADLTRLQTDPLRKQPLVNDLNAAATGAHPANMTITKLADDLASALGGKSLTPDQLRKLAQGLHALFNSSHLAATQQHTLLESVRQTLAGGAATEGERGKAQEVDTDLRAVVAATQ